MSDLLLIVGVVYLVSITHLLLLVTEGGRSDKMQRRYGRDWVLYAILLSPLVFIHSALCMIGLLK